MTAAGARASLGKLAMIEQAPQRPGSLPEAARNGKGRPLRAAAHRNGRGGAAHPVQLVLDGLVSASPTRRAPSRRSAAAEPPTEQFEVDAAAGMIVRRVTRSSGEVVRTAVAHALGLVGPAGLGNEELRRLADTAYLRGFRPHDHDCRVDVLPDGASAMEVRVADLFGGCGGMTLGVAEACRALGLTFRAVAAFEIDDLALGIYVQNFGGPEPKRDVSRVLSKRLTAQWSRRELALKAEIGRVDFVVAGPPCQGHSNLNNVTRRNDPKNELYFRVARFVRLFKPKWVLIENVPAVQHDAGKVVARTRRALERMGYSVDDAVVRVADLGVAQTRRRHILIASRTKGRGKLHKPHPSVAQVVARFLVRMPREVMWAIGDLMGIPANGTLDSSAKPSAETQRRIDWLYTNDAYELDDSQRPDCHRTKVHRYTSVYGRMRPTEPAPTITGGYDTMGRGRFVHPLERRTITPHEAARIQFFPDSFDFTPATSSRSGLAQVIGNAVPPKLAYAFALELMR